MPAPSNSLSEHAAAGRPTQPGNALLPTPSARVGPLVCTFVRTFVGALVLVFGCAVGQSDADDPPAPRPAAPEREILLSVITTDPAGQAERLAGLARAALTEGRPADALLLFVRLAETEPDTPVPLSVVLPEGTAEADGALRWPGRRVANLGLAQLPEPQQQALAARWGADAGVLEAAAAAGTPGALERLAAEFGALPAGRRALRTLARRDQERGDYVDVVRRLAAWMWLAPGAPPAQRAAVVAEWAEALHALRDGGGVMALAERYPTLARERVARGGRTQSLDKILWRRPLPPASPARGVDGPPRLPERLVSRWSRSLRDPSRIRDREDAVDASARVAVAGVLVEGNRLIVHADRRVVGLDLETGLERWRFPDGPLPRLPSSASRYLWPDLPVHTVTRAGDLVLVVLGEPGATGSYLWRDEIQDADSLRDELRLRLFALDAKTGAPRWTTGGVAETDPVLGSLATGVASPPLVVGDQVFVGLAQRVGVGTYYGACLDRATGAVRWVVRLGDGSSGRSPDRSKGDRFLQRHMHALAFGARPALAGDELCFVPHAGLAAGVRAADGRLRWVRALPRYARSVQHEPGEGPSARNTPQAFGATWILAPLDCPQLLALTRGTGTLRWMRGPALPGQLPVWRDLFQVGPDAAGRPGIWLSSFEGGLIYDARGVYQQPTNGVDPEAIGPGQTANGVRGFVRDGYVWSAQRGRLSATAFAPDEAGAYARVEVDLPAAAPAAADLLPLTSGWLLVGVDRLAFVADADGEPGDLAEPTPSAAARARAAVRAALRAHRLGEPALLAAAFERLSSVGEGGPRAAAEARLGGELASWLAEIHARSLEATGARKAEAALAQLAPLLWRLPPERRGPGLAAAAEAWLALRKGSKAVALLERWIEEPGPGLVATDEGPVALARVRIRGDLRAAALLRRVGEAHASGRAALRQREQRQLERVTAQLDAPEPALREAIRRAVGTEAADVGRRRLAARLLAADRFSEAAAVRADLRLDPSPRQQPTPTRLLRRLAREQIAEAGALTRAHEPAAARSLLIDVQRWAPPGLRDARGRSLADAASDLRRLHARRPVRRGPTRATLDVWRGERNPPEPGELGSIRFAGVRGPGAEHLRDVVLLVRGLTPELWSVSSGKRLAAFPGDDEGWFGGRLQSVAPGVPGGGILVTSIVAGEPADTSLVRGGDWIRGWGGRPVPDLPSFIRAVAATRPGEWIDVDVWRGGHRILERFRAGRRPLDQAPRRTQDAYSALWSDGRGRILFPSRSGLDWIDPKARTRQVLWRWNEPGTALRTDVFGGEVYVTIERAGFDDVLVAVDLESGAERWRRAIAGDVSRVVAVGSALWINASSPAGTWVLDRYDGSIRSTIRSLTTRRDEYRRTWTLGHVSAAAPAGRGFTVIGSRSDPELLCVNTTTGRVEWREAVGGGLSTLSRGRGGYLDPQLDADAVVAVVQGATVLRVIVPDPLGRAPRERRTDWIDIGANGISTDRPEIGGPFTDDSRLFVRGRTIHLLRNQSRRLTIFTIDIDFDRLGRGRTGQPAGDPVVMRMNERMLGGGGGRKLPYLIDAFADHDGLYVIGAQFGDEPWMEVRYASVHGTQRLINAHVLEARRHRPMRFGERLIVPTDAGAELFPLVPLGD